MSRRMDYQVRSREAEDWALARTYRHPLTLARRTSHALKLIYARAEISSASLYRRRGEHGMAAFQTAGARLWLEMAAHERARGLEPIPGPPSHSGGRP